MRVAGRNLESRVERKVCRDAEKLGVPNVKIKMPGWPDRLFIIIGGRPLFIEFKSQSGEEELMPLQDYWCGKLEKLGYDVVLGCTEYAVAMKAITDAIEKYKRLL